MSSFKEEMAPIQKDLKDLCDKYPQFAILAVVQPEKQTTDTPSFGLFGNLCAVCAVEFIVQYIVEFGITHESHKERIH